MEKFLSLARRDQLSLQLAGQTKLAAGIVSASTPPSPDFVRLDSARDDDDDNDRQDAISPHFSVWPPRNFVEFGEDTW